MLINIHENDNVRKGIIFAIVGDTNLIDKMQRTRDENGNVYYDIKFSVGGIELNFKNVIDRMFEYIEDEYKSIDCQIEEKARQLLSEKFDDTIQNLIDIQNRIKDEENKWKFKFEKKED